MGEQTNRNNVLFIGNGLDRLAGYNTDYPSFLWNYMNHYTEAIKHQARMEMSKKNISILA